MTKHAARSEAERYVDKLVKSQDALGYGRPKASVVRSAIGEAAEAVRALSELASQPKR